MKTEKSSQTEVPSNSPAVDRSVDRPVGLSSWEDYEKNYEQHWKHIIEPDGKLDMDAIKRELSDFWNVMEQVGKVYDHVTGGRISKVNTAASAVIGEAEAYYAHLENKSAWEHGYLTCYSKLWEIITGEWETKEAFIARIKSIYEEPNVEVTGDPLEAACGAGMFVI